MGTTMGKSGGNFLDSLPGTLHIVMLGLDSAGKTTALYRLKFDQYLNTVPTIGFNCEKVQGTIGKAKGVTFLVWDVGGQEKLRPLWRSYTRCTDGILFVVDSVDVERMEEAKMELMRTAKCPDNQGVPVLILANKQDLPGARDIKELEKLLGLHELIYPCVNLTPMSSCTSSSTGNIVSCSNNSSSSSNSSSNNFNSYGRSLTPTSQHQRLFGYGVSVSSCSITTELQFPTTTATTLPASSVKTFSSTSLLHEHYDSSGIVGETNVEKNEQHHPLGSGLTSNPLTTNTTPTTSKKSTPESKSASVKKKSNSPATNFQQSKGWYIQPACAITGEGLQEGLEALYEMIIKRRKINKVTKKKR